MTLCVLKVVQLLKRLPYAHRVVLHDCTLNVATARARPAAGLDLLLHQPLPPRRSYTVHQS